MHTRSQTAVRVAVALFAGAIATTSFAQTADKRFTYQGVIRNIDGTPVGPTVNALFTLHRTATGGPALHGLNYGELPVAPDGSFTQVLDYGDTVVSTTDPLYTGEPLYLQIQINGEILSPRQEITPAPIALSLPGAYSIDSQFMLGESMTKVNIGDASQVTNLEVHRGNLEVQSGNLEVRSGNLDVHSGDLQVLSGTLALNAPNNLAASIESASTIGTWIRIGNTSSGGRQWTIISAGSANGEGAGSFVLSDQSVGAPRMVINDVGNVGFGVSNPTERLDVGGAIRIRGADIVEGFDSSCGVIIEPGTVVSIDPSHEGELMPSGEAYDTKVAGVVSGAGGIPYGMALAYDGQFGGDTKVAMTGRVYVKCSAESGPIRAGDLLTSAAKPGHAMRASDRGRAHGSVIGKAMSSLDDGTGLVLVLVNLQ